MQFGTLLAAQCSSSRTYCYFHVPLCQYMSELAQSGCLQLGSHGYCLCYDEVCSHGYCLCYDEVCSHGYCLCYDEVCSHGYCLCYGEVSMPTLRLECNKVLQPYLKHAGSETSSKLAKNCILKNCYAKTVYSSAILIICLILEWKNTQETQICLRGLFMSRQTMSRFRMRRSLPAMSMSCRSSFHIFVNLFRSH